MGSARCRHFVQNAWKKDLCANCFKSRDEHVTQPPTAVLSPLSITLAPAPSQGILKGQSGSRKKVNKVCFPEKECEVIGEGGEDAGPPSDDDDEHCNDDDDSWATNIDDALRDKELEEDKILQALTRSNTDFNSVAANLKAGAPPPDPRKTRAQLQLGKTVTDSDGKKQTLLVSVQPFGGKADIATPKVHDTPEKGHSKNTIPQSDKSSDNGGVVLKSIVHTNGELPVTGVVASANNRNVPLETSSAAKDTQKKANGLPNGDSNLISKIGLGNEKPDSPLLLKQTSAQSPSEKTVSPKKDTAPQISSKHIFLKSIVDNAVTDDVLAKPDDSPKTNGKASDIYLTPVRISRPEGKRTHITRGTPISKNNELLLKTKFIPLRMSAIINKNETDATKNSVSKNLDLNKRNILKNDDFSLKSNGLGEMKSPDKTQIVAFTTVEKSPSPVITVKSIGRKTDSSSDDDDRTYSNVEVTTKDQKVEEGPQTKRLSSLLAATLKSSESEVLIVSGSTVGSRELAGEPDGRADPDSSSESGSEPPALPQSPPPSVDPRPSFLHGLTRIATDPITLNIAQVPVTINPSLAPVLPDKPKVPLKPNSVSQSAARWSQHEIQAKPVDPPQVPESSPPSTPPQGSDPGSRVHKRQAPKPPQVLDDSVPSTPERRHSLSPPPSPDHDEAPPKSPLCPNNETQSPGPHDMKKRVDRPERNRSSPPRGRGPARSESVPAALGQVALGQSVTLGAHSGLGIASALANAEAHSFVPMQPSPHTLNSPEPQPSPRRALSLSTDSLGNSPPKHTVSYDTERKKMGTKARFTSLRKFLRFSKDGSRDDAAFASAAELGLTPPVPRPRPRLEIIHPSDLSGNAVEVLRGSGLEVRRQLQEAAEAANRRNWNSDQSALRSPHQLGSPTHSSGRPSKPPPPPRSQSLENERIGETASIGRPSRPPPPKSADLLRRQKQPPSPPVPPPHSVYANLEGAEYVSGEVRCGMAPTKPQRTGSVRDAPSENQVPKRSPLTMVDDSHNNIAASPSVATSAAREPPKMPVRTCSLPTAVQPEDSGYESVELSDSTQPQSMTDENVYECVNGTLERSSSPECDSGSKRPGVTAQTRASASSHYAQHRRSDCTGLNEGVSDYQRFGTFFRSASVPYCGSETESDIYSPYSFYGSEEGEDGEADSSLPPVTSLNTAWKWRSRARKGRSIVHKSMEDNYGAVVGANHEALAQLLEQIRTGPTVPAILRPIKSLSSLSWSDFTLQDTTGVVVAGSWTFLSAHWGCHPVTLGVVPDPGSATGLSGRGSFALLPITEFCDLVPAHLLPHLKRVGQIQAWVSVLARSRVDTLSSYGELLTTKVKDTASNPQDREHELSETEEVWREASLALLQLVNALKALQAQGTEEANPANIVFLRDPDLSRDVSRENTPQLAILHQLHHTPEAATEEQSLCQCARAAVNALLPSAPASALLVTLLSKERAESLSRAKAVLEFWLWGPGDVSRGQNSKDREMGLQRWLDLERATVLHRLVCAQAAAGPSHRLAISQQSHLLFLVHTSAKTMCDASQLLDSHSINPMETTNF